MMPDSTPTFRKLNSDALPPSTGSGFLLVSISAFILAIAANHYFRQELFDRTASSYAIQGISSPVMHKTRAGEWHEWKTSFWVALISAAFARVVYFFNSDIFDRLDRLRAMIREDDPELFDEISSSIAASGIAPAPEVLTSKDQRSQLMATVTLQGRTCLRVDLGTDVIFLKDPKAFRARLFHELGHIAAGDVKSNACADALTLAMSVMGTIPLLLATSILLIIVQVTDHDLAYFFFGTIPLAVLMWFQITMQFYLTSGLRARLLRKRELYADWYAARLGNAAELKSHLERFVELRAGIAKGTIWQEATSRILRPAARRAHPQIEDRIKNIDNGSALLRADSQSALFYGAITAWMIQAASLTAQSGAIFFPGRSVQAYVVAEMLACGLLALLLNRSFGTEIQREALTLAAGYPRDKDSQGAGLCFVLGIEFGFLMWFGELSILHLHALLREIPWMTGVTFSIFWWTIFARFLTTYGFAIHTATTPPSKTLRRWIGLIIGATLFLNLLAIALSRQAMHGGIEGKELRFLLVSAVSMFVAAVFLDVMGLIAIAFCRGVFPVICPVCKAAAAGSTRLAKKCVRCDADLHPWLFAASTG